MSSFSRIDICWNRRLIYRCPQEGVKSGPEIYLRRRWAPSGFPTFWPVTNMIGGVARFLTAMTYDDSPRGYRIEDWSWHPAEVLIWRYFTRNNDTSLRFTWRVPRAQTKIISALLPLFTFVVTHFSYLVSHNNPSKAHIWPYLWANRRNDTSRHGAGRITVIYHQVARLPWGMES